MAQSNSQAMALRLYRSSVVCCLLVILYHLFVVSISNTYLTMTCIWVVPNLLNMLMDSVKAVIGSSASLKEHIFVEADAAVAKPLSCFFGAKNFAAALNGMPITGTETIDGVRRFQYSYWTLPWAGFLVISKDNLRDAWFKASPTISEWVRDSFANYREYHIVRFEWTTKEGSYAGTAPSIIKISGKSHRGIEEMIIKIEDLYALTDDDREVATRNRCPDRESRRTPCDLESLQTPLLLPDSVA